MTTATIKRNMSQTRRPQTQFVEALKTYTKTQEEKLQAGEPINKERLQEVVSGMDEITKRLKHVLKSAPDNTPVLKIAETPKKSSDSFVDLKSLIENNMDEVIAILSKKISK